MGQLIDFIERNPFGPVDRAGIEEFERRYEVLLPEDYATFLLNQNGGRPVANIHPLIGTDVHWLFGVHPEPIWASLGWNYETYLGRVPDGSIPIGCDSGGNLFLTDSGPGSDTAISFWSHDDETIEVHRVASSLSAFLEQLVTDPPSNTP